MIGHGIASRGVHARCGWAQAATVAVLLCSGPATPARADVPQPGWLPLPLTGRVTVKGAGKTFYVDGPQRIPKGAEIRVEADVTIIGINKASLEVAGGFEIHGTVDHWVGVEAIDFSPTLAPEGGFHFDMASLYACSFVHPEGKFFDGGLTIENSCLARNCKLDVRIRSGYLRFMTAEVGMPISVRSLPEKGKAPEVSFRTCWLKQTTLEGSGALMLRAAEVKGAFEARRVDDLILDGCDFFGDVKIVQDVEDSWSKVKLQKGNLFAGAKLHLVRPTGPKTKQEKVKVERFHFEGTQGVPALSDKEVAARILDGDDDPQVSVKAFWDKPNERKHVFLDKQLRMRAPPLR